MSLGERLLSGYSRTHWSRRSLAVAYPRRSFQRSDRIAARCFTSINQSQQRGRKLLGPIIEERLRSLNESGDEWADKPVGQPCCQTISALTIDFLSERLSIMADRKDRGSKVDCQVIDNSYNGCQFCSCLCESRCHLLAYLAAEIFIFYD